MFTRIASYLGIDFGNVSHTERLVSTAGGALVIFCIFVITRASLGPAGTLLIIPMDTRAEHITRMILTLSGY